MNRGLLGAMIAGALMAGTPTYDDLARRPVKSDEKIARQRAEMVRKRARKKQNKAAAAARACNRRQ